MPWRHRGVQAYGLADQVERMRALAALLHQHPQEVRGIGIVGLGLQHAAVTFFGRVQLAIAMQPHGKIQQFVH